MNTNFFKNLVKQEILKIHTTYLAKVLSVNGVYAKIQPLSLIKSVGGEAKKQTVIENVPISQNILSVYNSSRLVGMTVIVSCCDRDISRTRKGEFALPSIRDHSLSDSIIVDCLSESEPPGKELEEISEEHIDNIVNSLS